MTHPVLAAKQCVTIDHIAHGRYAFNAVMGLSGSGHGDVRREDARPRRALPLRRRMDGDSPASLDRGGARGLTFSGEYFELRGAAGPPEAVPGPLSAAHQRRQLACRDGLRRALRGRQLRPCRDAGERSQVCEKARAHAREHYQRSLSFMGIGFVVCRESQAEAERVARYIVERGDRAAARSYLGEFGAHSESLSEEFVRNHEDKAILGMGARQLLSETPLTGSLPCGAVRDWTRRPDARISRLLRGAVSTFAEASFRRGSTRCACATKADRK